MVTHLFDNTSWASPSSSAPNTDYAIGNRFGVTASVDVTGIRWYRGSTTATQKPGNLRLWRGDGTLLKDITTPSDNGTVGWQLSAFDAAVTLAPSTTYVVSMGWPNGQTWYWLARGSVSAPPSGYLWDDLIRAQFTGNQTTFPNNTDNTLAWGVDIETGGTTGGGGGGGGGLTGADLAAWLSSVSGTNTHQSDGLPWLIKTELDATKLLAQGAYDVLTNTPSGGSSLTSFLTAMGPTILAAMATFFSTANARLNGASGGGGSAFYGPSGTQVAEGVETLLAQGITPTELGAQLAVLRERLDLSPDLADTTRWTLQDTVNGSGDGLVNVQGDAYFLTLTTIPSHLPQHGIAGQLWVPRWGWVAPRVHGHFRQRQFSDVLPVCVTDQGLFMDGLLVYAHPGTDWTVEAYTLDRS